MFIKVVAIVALGIMLSGCMSDGNSLDAGLGGGLGSLGGGLSGLGLQGPGSSSLPGTDAFVKQQLERRGI